MFALVTHVTAKRSAPNSHIYVVMLKYYTPEGGNVDYLFVFPLYGTPTEIFGGIPHARQKVHVTYPEGNPPASAIPANKTEFIEQKTRKLCFSFPKPPACLAGAKNWKVALTMGIKSKTQKGTKHVWSWSPQRKFITAFKYSLLAGKGADARPLWTLSSTHNNFQKWNEPGWVAPKSPSAKSPSKRSHGSAFFGNPNPDRKVEKEQKQ